MSIDVLAPIVGFLAGILGGMVTAAVQYLSSRQQERWKYIVETRTDAYKSLMDALANLGIYTGALQRSGVTEPSPEQQQQLLILHTQLAAAHSKMALYASPQALAKAGAFFSQHAALKSDADYEGFIDMIEAMRDDSFADCYPEFRQHLDELMLRKALHA